MLPKLILFVLLSLSGQLFAVGTKVTPVPKDRFWLDLKNASNQSCGNMLIAYLPTATNGYDSGLDGLFFNDTAIALTTLIDNHECVIDALPSFTSQSVIALQFKTNIAGNYAINLQTVEGIFLGTQAVYIRDNQTGLVQNLKNGNLNFYSESGVFANRFTVLYDTTSLSTATTTESKSSVIIATHGTIVSFVSTSANLETISIFELNGKRVATSTALHAPTCAIDLNAVAIQTLIALITLENGATLSQLLQL